MDNIIDKALDYIKDNTDVGGSELDVIEEALVDAVKEASELNT